MHQGSVIYLDSYRTRSRRVNKWANLIRLYTRQKRLAEDKTLHSIESCHNRISLEIQAFFTEKRLTLNSNPIDSNIFFFDPSEIELLSQKIHQIISDELISRFNIAPTSKTTITNIFNEDLSSYFNLIQEWKTRCERSLHINQQIEKLSQSIWNESLNTVIPFQPLACAIEVINIPKLFLQSLEINSNDQIQTLQSNTIKRIEGVLVSLEQRYNHKLKKYSSQIFYTLHDTKIELEFNEKIKEFEDKALNLQTYNIKA